MKYLKTMLCGAAIAFALGAATASAKTLTIGIDLSGSNPLLAEKNFAVGAADYAAQQILELKSGDAVVISSFGARDSAANLRQERYVLSRKLRARELADAAKHYILSIPQQTTKGLHRHLCRKSIWMTWKNPSLPKRTLNNSKRCGKSRRASP